MALTVTRIERIEELAALFFKREFTVSQNRLPIHVWSEKNIISTRTSRRFIRANTVPHTRPLHKRSLREELARIGALISTSGVEVPKPDVSVRGAYSLNTRRGAGAFHRLRTEESVRHLYKAYTHHACIQCEIEIACMYVCRGPGQAG